MSELMLCNSEDIKGKQGLDLVRALTCVNLQCPVERKAKLTPAGADFGTQFLIALLPRLGGRISRQA